MGRYTYDELKEISKRIRAEFALKGIIIKKKTRRKPRDEEKRRLLFDMAMNRLKRYKPRKIEKGIILPYYSTKK
ncbi:MAG: hypothetical protein Fur0020_09210 [Thermodesulfovibrionia bacterium]